MGYNLVISSLISRLLYQANNIFSQFLAYYERICPLFNHLAAINSILIYYDKAIRKSVHFIWLSVQSKYFEN